MPERQINPSIGDITGTIGNLVLYNRKGKALVRRRPTRVKPFTAPELHNQSRFRFAQEFAREVMKVPSQRARYQHAATGQDASAQNIAISDFYHSPIVAEVDLTKYTGRAHELIGIRVEEGRIGAAQVRVRITGRADLLLEEGNAMVELDGVTWWYATQTDLEPDQPLWITVTAIDQPGNRTIKTVRHVSGT